MVDAGADVNVRDEENITCLHWAAINNRHELCTCVSPHAQMRWHLRPATGPADVPQALANTHCLSQLRIVSARDNAQHVDSAMCAEWDVRACDRRVQPPHLPTRTVSVEVQLAASHAHLRFISAPTRRIRLRVSSS